MDSNNWSQKFLSGVEHEMERINNDPFKRKVFNYIRNDLTGILNSIGCDYVGFMFNDKFMDKEFLQILTDIFKKHKFHEVMFNKKSLRQELYELFQQQVMYEEYVVGRKQEWFFGFMTDRELATLMYIYNNYD